VGLILTRYGAFCRLLLPLASNRYFRKRSTCLQYRSVYFFVNYLCSLDRFQHFLCVADSTDKYGFNRRQVFASFYVCSIFWSSSSDMLAWLHWLECTLS
jgi:hypothetical protein